MNIPVSDKLADGVGDLNMMFSSDNATIVPVKFNNSAIMNDAAEFVRTFDEEVAADNANKQ